VRGFRPSSELSPPHTVASQSTVGEGRRELEPCAFVFCRTGYATCADISRGVALGHSVRPHIRRAVSATDWIHHCRIAARHQLDERRDDVAHGHLRELKFAHQRRHQLLMLGIIDRHAGNTIGDLLEAVSLCAFELATQLSEIQERVSTVPSARTRSSDFDHALIKHFGFDDVARKYIGTRLVTDA